MKVRNSIFRILPILLVLIGLALSTSVVMLMRHVQYMLNADLKINLTEIVTQNKDAITSRLLMRMSALDVTVTKVTERLPVRQGDSLSRIQELLVEYSQANNTEKSFISDLNGDIICSDGQSINISGRNYFRLAVNGIYNISDTLISRFNGDEIFVISAPLYYKDEIIGTIHESLSKKEMIELCSLSLFSSQGYMYIVNSDGYIVLHSSHNDCSQRSDNFFRDLYANGNPSASEQIKLDIQSNHSGFMTSIMSGQQVFSAYTPIDKIHDWYLITSVPVSVVAGNGSTVIEMFYCILFVVVLLFTLILTYFLWNKNKQRADLERIVFVDSITGGHTYSKFLVEVPHVLERKDRDVFILQFDIDNFKYINNFYGFRVGDEVLLQIDKQIRLMLHPDEIIARVSSDHFTALLFEASEERVEAMLSSIDNGEIVLYFSAGIYDVKDKKESINLMVDKASAAAQSVKGRMHNKIAYYTSEFERNTLENEQMKRAVKQALHEKEFEPFYQPKVDINTGNIVGAEALVRWRKPDGSFIFPDQFIPLCERTGLIVDIDMLVYEEVLAFQRELHDKGLKSVPISVNFSRFHLQNADFHDKISIKLQEYHVSPDLMELELTESAFFDNMSLIYEFAEKVHALGMGITMDDFGSGYSSLHMLKDVPIDVLKIDRGFLSESRDNTRRNIIFSSIAEMAQRLGISVVVEGVEYLENVALMRECGCFIAQGYYFAKPMPKQAFYELLAEGRCLLPEPLEVSKS